NREESGLQIGEKTRKEEGKRRKEKIQPGATEDWLVTKKKFRRRGSSAGFPLLQEKADGLIDNVNLDVAGVPRLIPGRFAGLSRLIRPGKVVGMNWRRPLESKAEAPPTNRFDRRFHSG